MAKGCLTVLLCKAARPGVERSLAMARIVPIQTVDPALPTLTGSLVPRLQEVEDKFDIEVYKIRSHLLIYAAFLDRYAHLSQTLCHVLMSYRFNRRRIPI